MATKKRQALKDKKEYKRFIETAQKLQGEKAAENFEKACRTILKEKQYKN